MKKRKSENAFCTFYDYLFDKTTVRYVVMNETQNVWMNIFPNGMEEKINSNYNTVKTNIDNFPDNRDWFPGALVHLHLGHHITSMYDNSYKFGEGTKNLRFIFQECNETQQCQIIKTYVEADEGYGVYHELKHYGNENGFEVRCTFINKTGRTVCLEMISSATLDNLSPFMTDDGSRDLLVHRFKGGWSTEGKKVCENLPQMNMEKSWGGSFESEKWGSIGSKTVGRNYPYVAVEDVNNKCTWGIKLKHNSSWQIELTRCGTPLSLSCGLADMQFGAWYKNINNNEIFETPTAYIAVAKGGIEEVSNDLIEMNNRDIAEYGEEGMPIIFNDWCTHWGDTSYEKLIAIANRMKNSKVKYFVVDDGWEKNPVGNWTIDERKFPNGLKVFADEIKARGMVPGIWMEFEVSRKGADNYINDELFITRNNITLENAVSNTIPSKFLDFSNPQTVDYLENSVIKFLKDNGFGYLKVDYNSNIKLGCDGAESLGEGLRLHMIRVYNFFKKIKEEIPEIIIENCSSGGSRLEPQMMSVTAMSSFSDAHECIESPIIAANMHYLISPKQSQVWCVLKDCFDVNHMKYVIASGFLGRICWSGYIDKLHNWQMDMIYDAECFYEKVAHIIEYGRSYIYRTDFINNRYPNGTQAVIRYSEDNSEAIVVCHFFENCKEMMVILKGEYKIKDSLYYTVSRCKNNELILKGSDKSANVLYLERC